MFAGSERRHNEVSTRLPMSGSGDKAGFSADGRRGLEGGGVLDILNQIGPYVIMDS